MPPSDYPVLRSGLGALIAHQPLTGLQLRLIRRHILTQTQTELAATLGYTRQAVSRWECCPNEIPLHVVRALTPLVYGKATITPREFRKYPLLISRKYAHSPVPALYTAF
jgi:hypothetical protein